MSTKQVICLRTDLNMRKGKMIAQGAHASMKVFLDRALKHSAERLSDSERTGSWVPLPSHLAIPLWPEAEEWLSGAFVKICVGVDGEAALLDLYHKAEEAKLPCALIQDNGYTEFHGVPTYTALAIGPAKTEDIDKITGELKLL